MKISLLADIHANFPAFKKALEISEEEHVDLYLVAGDTLGFYPFPSEVLAVLKEQLLSRAIIIAGNHDHKVVTGGEFLESYSATIMGHWQRDRLREDQLSFIAGLPTDRLINLEDRRILLVHGSPNDPLEGRINGFSDLPEVENVDIVVFGHTHRPMVLNQGEVLWINPGSVGQPRDGDWRGSLCILELPGQSYKFLRFPYDVEAVAERWSRVSPKALDDRLIRWLQEGRYPEQEKR